MAGRTATVGVLAWAAFMLLAYFEPVLSSVAKIFAWPALLIAVGASVWISFLDCPRCGERFHGGESPLNDECYNCGLTHRELSAVAKPPEHA
jgi:hypothetical protein